MNDVYGPTNAHPESCICGICEHCGRKNKERSDSLNDLTDHQKKELIKRVNDRLDEIDKQTKHDAVLDSAEREYLEEKANRAVDHPSHYRPGKIEVIDVIEDWQLGFHLGNAVKYIARAGRKDPNKKTEDIEKALWYLKRWMELYGPQKHSLKGDAGTR